MTGENTEAWRCHWRGPRYRPEAGGPWGLSQGEGRRCLGRGSRVTETPGPADKRRKRNFRSRPCPIPAVAFLAVGLWTTNLTSVSFLSRIRPTQPASAQHPARLPGDALRILLPHTLIPPSPRPFTPAPARPGCLVGHLPSTPPPPPYPNRIPPCTQEIKCLLVASFAFCFPLSSSRSWAI